MTTIAEDLHDFLAGGEQLAIDRKLHHNRLSTKLTHPSDLLPVFRRTCREDWLLGVANAFPFAGVPVSPRRSLGCRQCYEAQEKWLAKKIAVVPIVRATPNQVGYIQCPGCGGSFSTADRNAFQNQMHLRCGQKIHVACRT